MRKSRIIYEDKDGEHEVATLDDGMKYGGDFGEVSQVKLNKQVNIVGGAASEEDLTDGNIGVVSSQDGENGKLEIKLSKDLQNIETIQVNKNITVGDNITIDGDTTNITVGDTVNEYVLKGTVYEGDNKTINISEDNVISVIEGKVAKGDKGVVTGDTVYNETRVKKDGNYIKKGNTAAENITALDNKVGDNARNIENLGNAINNTNNQINGLDNRMKKGLAGAAARMDRLVRKGITLDSKIAKEFEPELGRIYVERISGQDNDRKKIERVRVNNSDSKYPEGKTRDVYGSKIQPVVSEKAAGE